MKVLAPVDKVGEAEEVIRAGADELYCGVLSAEWSQEYSIAAINRRPARICNFESFDELRNCVEIAHSYDVPVSLTINEHYYTREQYPLLVDYIEKAVDAGVDSFLISDLALLLFLNELNLDIKAHISTGGTTFNSETAKFYQSLGVSRITIPRHLTIGEIREITENISNIETCVFIFNSRCPNIDGFCTFMHIQSRDPSYKNACMLPYSLHVVRSQPPEDKLHRDEDREFRETTSCVVRQQVWERFHMDDIPCGVCALYEFEEMGIDYVKIVGRGNPTERKVNDLKFIRLLLAPLEEQGISKEEFREKARRLYMSTYRLPCRTIMCYYPEVMNSE